MGLGEHGDPGHASPVSEAMQVNVEQGGAGHVHRPANRAIDVLDVVEMARAPQVEKQVGAGEDLSVCSAKWSAPIEAGVCAPPPAPAPGAGNTVGA